MTYRYRAKEKQRQVNLLRNSSLFNNAKGDGLFRKKNREFVLIDNDVEKNLYCSIRETALKYFKDNHISWWGGKTVTGHLLSSQVACLNHLFAIRNDENTVLSVVNVITGEIFSKVLPVNSNGDEYIDFEVVSKVDHLNEGKLTRGSNCTSIDALILAERQNGNKCIIPIEWKYTENYDGKANKAQEDGKGVKRLGRYRKLMATSRYLKSLNEIRCASYVESKFFVETYYELMRQTLWAEQMIIHSDAEDIKADDFIHLIVIPSGNESLIKKVSKWPRMLSKSKFLIVDPKSIVDAIEKTGNYNSLVGYLKERYNY